MLSEKIISSLFLLTNKLKDNELRKGWFQRYINRFRVESVAEHIYKCQMLAYAMFSEFKYDIDINKVILLLAVHEIGETIIGDITIEDMDSKTKSEIERDAVFKLTEMIPNGEFLRDLYLEFEDKTSKEAEFAYMIDKAECDLQAKLYVQEGCFSHKYTDKEFIDNWIRFDRERINFDENFDKLLEYIMNNDMVISKHCNNPYSNVISFYTSTSSLCDKRRRGEEIWNVSKERFGSVAEHIYSVQMLAISFYLVYGSDVDIKKVINLISTHELGEIIIGDIDALTKTDNDRVREYEGAMSVINILTNKDLIINQLDEFNKLESEESKFSKYCDKLTPDIISKIYDLNNYIDLNLQDGNPLLNNKIVKKHLDSNKDFSSMWILYGQEVYNYPEPFISVSNYVLNNNIIDTYNKVFIKI